MQLQAHIKQAIQHHANSMESANFYLYDTTVMRHKIEYLQHILPQQVDAFYAMKANPHPAFIQAAKTLHGIEVASIGEAKKALNNGLSADRLIFTGPGKTPEELRWSVQSGVRTVHIESLVEAHRLESICATLGKKQDILLRVNANFDIHDAQTTFSGGSRKFGVDEETLTDVLETLIQLPHLNFCGLHVFAASGVLRVQDLIENCRLVFEMVKKIEHDFPLLHCDIIDFGGGFGVDYLETGQDFDVAVYAHELRQLIQSFHYQDRRLVLELGRYLAADSGWFCTEILDIKLSRGKKQLICVGGINHFRRPAALAINHPVSIVQRHQKPLFDAQVQVRNEQVYFGGPLCTGADKLANDVYIESADVGDIAVFSLAGAYGLTMSNTLFLSHPMPDEVIILESQTL